MTTDRSSDKHGSGAGDDHTRNVTIVEPEDDMTADDESKLTKVNTELSAVVNHLAKLNDSGDVKAMTDREKTRG